MGGGSKQEQLDQQQQQLREFATRIDKERQYQQQVCVWCVRIKGAAGWQDSGVHAGMPIEQDAAAQQHQQCSRSSSRTRCIKKAPNSAWLYETLLLQQESNINSCACYARAAGLSSKFTPHTHKL